MKITTVKLIFLLLLLGIHSKIEAQKSRLVTKTIPAPSLENNMLGIPATQSLLIYLPPSYDNSDKRYPVVYYLLGYTTRISELNYFKQLMDRIIANGTIKEFIVVIIEGYNFMGGHFYVNSPVTGNCENLIIYDVIGYIDDNFRTIKNRESRGITGISMGGFGALNIAMKHPDIFSSVYSLSPGLFDKNGLTNCQLFKSQSFINQFLQKEQEYSSMSPTDAMASFKSYIQSRFNAGDYDTPFTYAYGFAFSPNPNKQFPFMDYPYSKQENNIVVDSTKLWNFENGFGGLERKVVQYKENFLKLKSIGIDYGIYDEYKWIPQGCKYFSELLTAAGIPHIVETFNGGHTNQLTIREEKFMLPFFSKNLNFDSLHTDIKLNKLLPDEFQFYQNYPNPFNPETNIGYQLSTRSHVELKIFDLQGREVKTLVNKEQDAGDYEVKFNGGNLSGGVYLCRIKTGRFTQIHKMLLLK